MLQQRIDKNRLLKALATNLVIDSLSRAINTSLVGAALFTASRRQVGSCTPTASFSVSDQSLYFGLILTLDCRPIYKCCTFSVFGLKKLLKLSIRLVQPKTLSAAADGLGVGINSQSRNQNLIKKNILCTVLIDFTFEEGRKIFFVL